MASTVSIYKGATLIGTGSAAAGSATISSWSPAAGQTALGRQLTIAVTQAGAHVGRAWSSRVLSAGATLVLVDACPFVGA